MVAITVVWFLLYFLESVFFCCKGEVVGGCFQEVEGSRCHEVKKPWQHDGVCVMSSEGVPGRCIVPNSGEFKLAVVARWRRLVKFPEFEAVTTLWMRGSGPGLSWEKSIELKRTASAVDVWRAELFYTSGSSSYPCYSPSHCSMNQGSLEFRLYRDELAIDGMFGPNFYVPLPLSHSLSGTVDFLMPTVTVAPWYDGVHIDKVMTYSQLSSKRVTGKKGGLNLKLTLLHPPSFNHNIRRTYPVVILFGKKEAHQVIPLLEQLFVREAIVEEVFVVVIEYLDKAPFCTLNPFSTDNVKYVCNSGETCHDCQSCWDDRRAERCDEEEFIDKTNRCLRPVLCQGRGDEVLDMIEFDILPDIQERAANRLLLDFPRNRLSIIGMDGAGLLACYAALTRPAVYANAGCLSAPFNWPMSNVEAPFDPEIMERILTTIHISIREEPSRQFQYLTQKYYVDNGEYDSFYFPSIDAHKYSNWFVSQLQDIIGLRMHKNIVYANLPGLYNSYYHQWYHGERVLHTLRYPLSFFFRAEGGPSEKFPRKVNIKQELYAKSAAKLSDIEHLEVSRVEEESQAEGGEKALEKTLRITNHSFDFCMESDRLDGSDGVPVPIFLAFTGLSVLVSVAVTVMIMCLRESNRRAAEEADKEEADLAEELGSSDDDEI